MNNKKIENQAIQKREQIKGMVIYCDECKKHTTVYSIASGSLTIVTLYSDCCDKIIK